MPTPTFTSKLLLRKPDPDPATGDFVNVQTDVNENMDKLDDHIGAKACTDVTRPPTPFLHEIIRETNTGRMYICTNTVGPVWSQIVLSGTSFLQAGGGSTATFRSNLSSGTATGNRAWAFRGAGETTDRFWFDHDGMHQWAGTSGAGDTNLYRSAANVLKTDDSFHAGAGLSVLSGGASVTGNLSVSGIGQEQYVEKTADQSRLSNTALINDNHLFVSVAANATYVFEIYLMTSNSGAGDPDLKLGLTFPSGTISWTAFGLDVAALGSSGSLSVNTWQETATSGATINRASTTTMASMMIKGRFKNGVTAGTLRLQFAQVTSVAVNTTLFTGSYMLAKRVA